MVLCMCKKPAKTHCPFFKDTGLYFTCPLWSNIIPITDLSPLCCSIGRICLVVGKLTTSQWDSTSVFYSLNLFFIFDPFSCVEFDGNMIWSKERVSMVGLTKRKIHNIFKSFRCWIEMKISWSTLAKCIFGKSEYLHQLWQKKVKYW